MTILNIQLCGMPPPPPPITTITTVLFNSQLRRHQLTSYVVEYKSFVGENLDQTRGGGFAFHSICPKNLE